MRPLDTWFWTRLRWEVPEFNDGIAIIGKHQSSDDDQHILAQVFLSRVIFACVVYYLLQWLLSQCLMRSCGSWRRRSCAFSDGTTESQGGRSGWALPIVESWSLDGSQKWPKTWFGHVTWFKQNWFFILGHVKLIQGVPFFKSIMTQKHTDVCPPASGPHGGWTADLTSIHIFQFHCTGTNYFHNMCDYTFKNIGSDATWHLTSGGPPDGTHRKLLFVPGPNGNWRIQNHLFL